MKKNNKNKGNIYLIPTTIAEKTQDKVLPAEVPKICSVLDLYMVENVRTARRFISSLKLGKSIEDLEIFKIPDDQDWDLIGEILTNVESGRDLGIISEAGCPAIADPGAAVVAEAHRRNIEVIPLVGPSSILLALIASGLNGQSFRFHGYLPIRKEPLSRTLRSLEKEAIQTGTTQIFMETPYRNESLYKAILSACGGKTMLCIAKNLTDKNMEIRTRQVHKWRRDQVSLNKQPTIFLIGRSDY